MTYPTSPKHLALYHKFGYRPKALTALMSRVLDRNAPRPATKLARGPLAVRRFSQLEETKKKAGLARVHRITNALYRGLDVAKEVEIVDGLALGDTLLLERGRDLVGFAVVHTPGVSEAPFGTLYVKYMAVDPAQKRVEHLEQFVAAVEDLGHELGVQRVALPVYLRYWLAYSTLVRCGYQVDFTMLRMQKGKQEDYEDPTHLVLDDWRWRRSAPSWRPRSCSPAGRRRRPTRCCSPPPPPLTPCSPPRRPTSRCASTTASRNGCRASASSTSAARWRRRRRDAPTTRWPRASWPSCRRWRRACGGSIGRCSPPTATWSPAATSFGWRPDGWPGSSTSSSAA